MKILVISNYRPYHTARPEAEIFIGLSKLGVEIDIMTYGDAVYFNKFKEAGINGLNGHRSVGGYRASMYNAMPLDSVKALVEVMSELETKA